jgi:hypothetical protein
MNRRERRQRERELDKKFGIPKSQKIETKNTFGCEVFNDYISKNQMELLGKIGLRNIIKVKRRKNGMTSSMKPNGCHSNVRILVERCGGKQLLGYMICGGGGLFDTEQNGEEPFQMVYHSVWITPEGEVIEPTLSNYQTKNERGYTYFTPLFIYKDEGFWIEGSNLIFPNGLLEKGFYISNTNYGGGIPDGDGDFIFPLTQLCWRNTLWSNLYETKEERLKSTHGFLHNGSGGFTEPSIKEQRLKVG